jgi:hypothetical protein
MYKEKNLQKGWFMTTNSYPLNQDIFEDFHFGAAEEVTAEVQP